MTAGAAGQGTVGVLVSMTGTACVVDCSYYITGMTGGALGNPGHFNMALIGMTAVKVSIITAVTIHTTAG